MIFYPIIDNLGGNQFMIDIIAKIIPVLALIVFGWYIRYGNIFKQCTIDDIKKVVINVALSAVLFITFLNMELRPEYFIISFVSFVFLNIFYLVGFMVKRIKIINYSVTPFITSGFAFGLLGVPLFTTAFGAENLGKISILGIGNEFFVWGVFFTVLRMKYNNEKFSLETAKEIVTSPLMISIILGIIFNLAGLSIWFKENPFANGLYITLEYLSDLATPLILIIIGYGLKINKKYIKQSLKLTFLRIAVILTIGYAFKYFLVDYILPADKIFDYAYFTFLILPPPFATSIFIGKYSVKENEELANNTVVMSTLFCITAFILFLILLR